MTDLKDRKILILATDGFEDAELYSPRQALLDAGAKVTLASPKSEPIRGCIYNAESGSSDESPEAITPDRLIADVNASQFDALVLLRMDGRAIALVKYFAAADKPIASICHGPWLLVEADVMRGRRATAWYSIRTDLKNAGSTVVDEDVVVDGNIITSRMPSDIPAFTKAIVTALAG